MLTFVLLSTLTVATPSRPPEAPVWIPPRDHKDPYWSAGVAKHPTWEEIEYGPRERLEEYLRSEAPGSNREVVDVYLDWVVSLSDSQRLSLLRDDRHTRILLVALGYSRPLEALAVIFFRNKSKCLADAAAFWKIAKSIDLSYFVELAGEIDTENEEETEVAEQLREFFTRLLFRNVSGKSPAASRTVRAKDRTGESFGLKLEDLVTIVQHLTPPDEVFVRRFLAWPLYRQLALMQRLYEAKPKAYVKFLIGLQRSPIAKSFLEKAEILEFLQTRTPNLFEYIVSQDFSREAWPAVLGLAERVDEEVLQRIQAKYVEEWIDSFVQRPNERKQLKETHPFFEEILRKSLEGPSLPGDIFRQIPLDDLFVSHIVGLSIYLRAKFGIELAELIESPLRDKNHLMNYPRWIVSEFMYKLAAHSARYFKEASTEDKRHYLNLVSSFSPWQREAFEAAVARHLYRNYQRQVPSEFVSAVRHFERYFPLLYTSEGFARGLLDIFTDNLRDDQKKDLFKKKHQRWLWGKKNEFVREFERALQTELGRSLKARLMSAQRYLASVLHTVSFRSDLRLNKPKLGVFKSPHELARLFQFNQDLLQTVEVAGDALTQESWVDEELTSCQDNLKSLSI